MVSPKFFRFQFGASGDRAAIPDETQVDGSVSWNQGFGPDYERDPGSDPLAKRVPRDETNQYLFDVTDNLRAYQLVGTPDWYPASVNNGVSIPYDTGARVRYDDGSGVKTYISLVTNNTALPTDTTKWTVDTVFNLSVLEATLTEALAGSIGTKIITPRRLASAVQRGTWAYAVAGGTANALTATLSPVLATLAAGFSMRLRITNANTGAATLAVDATGAKAIKTLAGQDLTAGDLVAGAIMDFDYDSVTDTFIVTNLAKGIGALGIGAVRTFTASGTWTRPAGCRAILVEVYGGGGAGAGASAPGAGNIRVGGGGGAGGFARKLITAPPASQAVVVGTAGAGTNGSGGAGGSSSFGTVVGNGGGGASLEAPTNVTNASSAGGGGSASGGDINAAGTIGSRGIALINNNWGGDGASAPLGGGGFGSGTSLAGGGNATGYAAGGGGAVASNTTGNVAGGNGAPGIVIVTEYY